MNEAVVVLTLPPPPTTNNLFVNLRRPRGKFKRSRAPSKRYEAWQREAGWELKRQRLGCIGGPWEADIALPSGLTGDLDNYTKPILDLLVTHRVVDDDKFCRRLTVAKAVTVGPVIVTLKAAANE